MRRQGILLAREPELAKLALACNAAQAGSGQLLLLAGEAGVGKTRLAEAATAASGLPQLQAAATTRVSTPYAPVVAALRAHLRREPNGLSDLGPLGAQLGALLPELELPQEAGDRETLAEAIRAAFERVGRFTPSIVFFDDLHWGDAATLELLPSLAEAAEEWPVLFLGAYRSEEIPRGHPLRRLRTDLRRAGRLHELVVEPLGPAATADLATVVLGGKPSPTLRAALYDRTEGVPFFVEELAAALKASSRLSVGRHGLDLAAGASVPMPDTIRDAVRLRAESLSSEARGCLEAAAVVGVRVELELLSALDRDAGLDEVLAHGLLDEIEPGIAAFRHDLTREAIYADTHWPRRRGLHRALAELLETRGAQPRSVAEHWLAAGEPQRARPRLLEAARGYCRVHAYRDAAGAVRAALELWPEDDDEPGRLEVLDELGRCAELCGELAEAQRAWEAVTAGLEHSRNGHRRAAVQQRLAIVYELQNAWAKAAVAHTDAAEAFDAFGNHAEAASEWLRAAEAQGDAGEAIEQLERAGKAASLAGRADLELRSLSARGFWLGMTGRRDEGLALVRSVVSRALAGNHVDAALDGYWMLGAVANAWSDFDGAQSAFEEAVELCRAHGRPSDEEVCLSCLAVSLRNRGEWTRAEQLSRDVLQSSGTPMGMTHALVTLGYIAATRGATKRGRSLLTRGLERAREVELAGSILDGESGLALVDELEGRPSPYWRELVRSRPELLSQAYAPAVLRASTFAALRGDAEVVRACADALVDWTIRFGNAQTLAALAHVLGNVALLEGRPERAVEHFTQALELLKEVDSPFERAATQNRFGVALAAAGEHELGVEALTSAYRTFRRLGARPFAAQVAADLGALGEKVEERLGRWAAGQLERGGLTRRELEILRLVAVGRTNREIAQQLFLSSRTVDMHVRNMLGKLGCRSRTEATGKAHELGLIEVARGSAILAGTGRGGETGDTRLT